MKKNFTKIICFGILSLFLWGCGESPEPSDSQHVGSTSESASGQSGNRSSDLPEGYVLSALFEDAGRDTKMHRPLHTTHMVGNSLYYNFTTFDQKQNTIVTNVYIQEKGKEPRLLDLPVKDRELIRCIAVGEDSCLYLLYEKQGEDENIEAYTLEKRDKDLKVVYSADTTADIKEAAADMEEASNVYIDFMEAGADGKLYGLTSNGIVLCWDEAGTYQGSCTLPNGLSTAMYSEKICFGLANAGSSGVYAYWGGTGELNKRCVLLYDLKKWLEMDESERKDAAPLQVDFSSAPESMSINTSDLFVFSGYEDGLYLTDPNRLWQISLTDGSGEPLLTWQDFTLKSGYVTEIRRQEGGGFLLYAFDSLEQENYWVTLEPVPADELPEKTELVLGIADNSRSSKPSLLTKIDQVILSYNRTHPDSHVTVQKYPESSLTNLQLELINGKGPDILMELESFFDMETLMSKGALEDLASYLAGSGAISDEDILPGILTLITDKDGRIPRIPLSFSAGIMILPKDRPQEIMTPQEAVRFMAQGENEYVDMFMWPQTFLIQVLSGAEMDQFVDSKNKSCSFNSEEFISLLEQTAELADIQMIMEHGSRFEPFRSGQLSAIVDNLSCMGDYLCIRASLSDMADITGYPNSSRELRYPAKLYDWLGINSASGHKEEAWGFVEFCLAYISRSDDVADRFAVTKDKFDRQTQFGGDDGSGSLSYQVLGNLFLAPGYGMVDFGPATQEETDFLREIPEHLYLYENENLLRVISEEASAFFAGDISAREAAERIQNRASLVLAE